MGAGPESTAENMNHARHCRPKAAFERLGNLSTRLAQVDVDTGEAGGNNLARGIDGLISEIGKIRTDFANLRF